MPKTGYASCHNGGVNDNAWEVESHQTTPWDVSLQYAQNIDRETKEFPHPLELLIPFPSLPVPWGVSLISQILAQAKLAVPPTPILQYEHPLILVTPKSNGFPISSLHLIHALFSLHLSRKPPPCPPRSLNASRTDPYTPAAYTESPGSLAYHPPH